MLIFKKINNNVALAASDDGREVVVFGKGIGFHEMPYELADESLIQRKFYNVPESLQDMVGTLPDDVLLAASDIACFASQQLGCKLSGGLPFILADHLQFAVQRDDDQLSAPNPLEHEVAFIYPRELEIGQAALAIVQKRTGAKLGQNEATSIALHIVNAEVDGMGRAKDMDFIMKSTRVLDEVTHSVEKQLGCSLDTASYSYIRFLAHLRVFGSPPLQGQVHADRELLTVYAGRPRFSRGIPVRVCHQPRVRERVQAELLGRGTLVSDDAYQPSAIGFADRVSKAASPAAIATILFGF